jgi:hypothetical protein
LLVAWENRTNGKDEKIIGTADLRIARDIWMWDHLKNADIIFYGMRSTDSGWAETGGDPAGPLIFWWTYGFISMVFQIIMFISTINRLLFKMKYKNSLNHREIGVLGAQIGFILSYIVQMFAGFGFAPIVTVTYTIAFAWCASSNYEIISDKDKNIPSNEYRRIRI